MKKIMSLLISVIMVMSFALSAFAASVEAIDLGEETEETVVLLTAVTTCKTPTNQIKPLKIETIQRVK